MFLYLLLRVDSCSWHLLFFTYYIHPTTVLLPSAACLLLHATSRNPRAIYPTQTKQASTTAPSNCLALTCVPGKPHTPRNPSATHLSRQFQQTPPTPPNTSNNPAAGSSSTAYITSSNTSHLSPEWPPWFQVSCIALNISLSHFHPHEQASSLARQDSKQALRSVSYLPILRNQCCHVQSGLRSLSSPLRPKLHHQGSSTPTPTHTHTLA